MRVHHALAGILAAVLAVLGTTADAGAQSSSAVRSLVDPPPPGRLIDVGGHRLHLHCVGEGSPVVIFDAGAGAWSIFYSEIQESVAGETRACAYDRAGLGWSGPGPMPRTSRRMAEELHALLEGAGIEPPYVLVGHSLGGYTARLFADLYPDQVAGIVLAESAHEEQWERLPAKALALVRSAVEFDRKAAVAARRGALPPESVPPWAGPPELRPAYESEMADPSTYDARAAEMDAAVESAAQVRATGDLRDLPLAVVTARNSFAAFQGTGIPIEPANAAWMAMQEELLELSSASRWFVSETGDHRIQRTDPDLLVEAIRFVVGTVRGPNGHGVFLPMPLMEELRVLPPASDPEVDGLLARLEQAYTSMDVERFVSLFGEDFEQVDINRRVHVRGREAWRRQTERVNAAHHKMERIHHGRARVGEWVVVEIEWSGAVRGEVLGQPGHDRPYRYSGMGLLELEKGGIRRQILFVDFRTLLNQLGQVVMR
ncbi:MAG: alpha/beta fold hydrolase [Gemmatimonadota bacterium]